MRRLVGSLSIIAGSLVSALALAEGDAVASSSSSTGVIAIGAALCMGIAAFAGAFGQGKAASAALEGIARNPQAQKSVFTPMLLGMALIEAIVILAFTIAILLWTKI